MAELLARVGICSWKEGGRKGEREGGREGGRERDYPPLNKPVRCIMADNFSPSGLGICSEVAISDGSRIQLHFCAVDIISRQFPVTQLTNQMQSLQVLWPQARFTATTANPGYTNWTSQQTAQSDCVT